MPLLPTNWNIAKGEEVRLYLDKYPDLSNIVTEVCRKARSDFGPNASLTLQVYHDPEIEDEYLVLYVRLPSYPPDIMARIRAVTAAHECQLSDMVGTILVTTDFGSVQ